MIIIIIIILLLAIFLHQHQLVVFSLESEWLQISSSLQDSSEYSCRSQQLSTLYGLVSPSDIHLLRFFLKASWDRPKPVNYNWYHGHPDIRHFFFNFSSEVQVFVYLFVFFYVPSVFRRNAKVHKTLSYFFFSF